MPISMAWSEQNEVEEVEAGEKDEAGEEEKVEEVGRRRWQTVVYWLYLAWLSIILSNQVANTLIVKNSM